MSRAGRMAARIALVEFGAPPATRMLTAWSRVGWTAAPAAFAGPGALVAKGALAQ